MKAFLSIDVGTSSTKLSLYDSTGQPLAAFSAGYAVEIPRPGWAEQDPLDWWRAVCALGPQAMAALGSHTLAAISVGGQAPLCVPVDERGQALRKAILWMDRRATPQVDWLRQRLGEERCQAVSANRLDSYFGGVKWLWFLQNEPGLYRRTWKILQANSYVAYHLTGQAAIDPSQAGLCSPCYDSAANAWNAGICAAMGLDLERLPDIRPPQAVIGAVLPQAARASGLPAGTPVVCGGGDFACACLGAGVAGRGTAALMLGSAGNLLFPGVSNPDARLLHTRHLSGQPLTFGGVMAGGNLKWFGGLFDEAGIQFYESQDAAAAQLPAGSEGLLYLPCLMGERTPIWDPEARGAFVGLSSRHTRAHLYRAVLEGVAFAFRAILDITGSAGLEAIVAIDGGARSAVWRAILASVLEVPVRRTSPRSGTGLGAAFLAALGVGAAGSFAEIQDWVEILETTFPDSEACRRYAELYPLYAGLYPRLKPDFERLSQLQDRPPGKTEQETGACD